MMDAKRVCAVCVCVLEEVVSTSFMELKMVKNTTEKGFKKPQIIRREHSNESSRISMKKSEE